MQKLFVLLTLLCASLSGSNAVAEFIEKRTDTLVNTLDGRASDSPDIDSESLASSTYVNDSDTLSNRSVVNAVFSELTLGLANAAKFGMEEGDNSDSFLIQAYCWIGFNRHADVDALETTPFNSNNFSSYAIRAPPYTLS